MLNLIKRVLKSDADWEDYKYKLNYVYKFQLIHIGAPDRYPAMVISEYSEDPVDDICVPSYVHQFVYGPDSYIDDLAERITEGDEEALRSAIIASNNPSRLGQEENDDQWGGFWEGMDAPVTEVPYSSRKLKEVKFQTEEEGQDA